MDDGTIVKGVSRQNRLRTVIGMLYRDRNDKFNDINKLRSMLVQRDKELRDFQNLYSREQEERKKFEDQVSDFIVKTKGLEEDLENNKKTYDDYKEATTTKMGVLEDNIASLEQRIQNNQKEFEATMLPK